MQAESQSSRRVEETKVETGRIKLPIAFWALAWTIAGAVLAGVWNASAAYSDQKNQMSSQGRDIASVVRAVQKLEKRIDVDNMTRYTVGDATRDFAMVGGSVERAEKRIDDHETRLRVLERARAEEFVATRDTKGRKP